MYIVFPLLVNVILDGIGDILQAFNNLLIEVSVRLLQTLDNLVTTTPYPKDSEGDPSFIGRPSSAQDVDGGASTEIWSEMYTLFETTSDLAVALLLILLLFSFGAKIFSDYLPDYNPADPGELVQKAILVVIWWPLAVMLLVTGDILTQFVVELGPSSNYPGSSGLVGAFNEIRESAGLAGGENPTGSGTASGIKGIALTLALVIPLVLQSSLMILLLVLWIVRYVAIFIITPIMPLVFVINSIDIPGNDYIDGLGDNIMEIYITVIFLSFPGAIVITAFGQLSGSLLEQIDRLVTGGGNVSGGSESAMTLADGAAATGDLASIAGEATTFFAAIILMSVLPLIAAGGPWILAYIGNDKEFRETIKSEGSVHDLYSGAKSKAKGAARAAGDIYNAAGGNLHEEKVEEGGQTADGDVSGSGGNNNASGSADQSTQERAESRIGRMKQRMSSSMETAKEIKEDASEFRKKDDLERASVMADKARSGGSSVSSLMQQKAKDGVSSARDIKDSAQSEIQDVREYGVSEVSRKHRHNAQTRAANAMSEANVAVGDGAEELRERAGDLSEQAEENLQKQRKKIEQAKMKASQKAMEAQVEEGGFVEGMGRVATQDIRDKWDKDPIVDKEEFENSEFENVEAHKQHKLDESQYDTMEEFRNAKLEEYREEELIERRDSGDILTERGSEESVDEAITESRKKVEDTMKSLGVWEDYQNNDKTASETVQDAIGHEESADIHINDLPDEVAREVFDDPDIFQSVQEENSSVLTNSRKQQLDDKVSEETTEYENTDELVEAVENGEKIEGSYYDPDELATRSGDIDVETLVQNVVGDTITQPTTEEEFRDKHEDNIESYAEKRGYDSVKRFMDKEVRPAMEENQRKQENNNTVSDRQDNLGRMFGDGAANTVESTEVANTVEETEEELDEMTRDLARIGQNADPEQMRDAGIANEVIDDLYESDRTPQDFQASGSGFRVDRGERDEMIDSVVSTTNESNETREFTPEPSGSIEDFSSAIAQVSPSGGSKSTTDTTDTTDTTE